MLTGFAGYSGNRGVRVRAGRGGEGREGKNRGRVVESGGTMWVMGGRSRWQGGVGGFVYAEGGVRGCQLLDDSL